MSLSEGTQLMRLKDIVITLIGLFLSNFLVGRTNEIQRRFIPPTRIVWKSDTLGNQLKNVESLLQPGIHQADLYSGNYC